MIRVLIASAQPTARDQMMARLVDVHAGIGAAICVVGAVDVGHATLHAVRRHAPDVVVIDGRSGAPEALASARSVAADARVLMLTDPDDADLVMRAIRAGAAGHLVADADDRGELARAVEAVNRGGSYISPLVAPVVLDLLRAADPAGRSRADHDLTEREAEVMSLIAAGMSNTAIAARLFISEKTVKNHINRAYGKLDISSRREAIRVWRGVPAAA